MEGIGASTLKVEEVEVHINDSYYDELKDGLASDNDSYTEERHEKINHEHDAKLRDALLPPLPPLMNPESQDDEPLYDHVKQDQQVYVSDDEEDAFNVEVRTNKLKLTEEGTSNGLLFGNYSQNQAQTLSSASKPTVLKIEPIVEPPRLRQENAARVREIMSNPSGQDILVGMSVKREDKKKRIEAERETRTARIRSTQEAKENNENIENQPKPYLKESKPVENDSGKLPEIVITRPDGTEQKKPLSKQVLTSGRKFKKFCLNSFKVTNVHIRFSQDGKTFFWRSERNEERQMPMSDFQKLLPGKTSDNFKRYVKSKEDPLDGKSFSLVFGKRSIDLIANTKEECHEFMEAFIEAQNSHWW